MARQQRISSLLKSEISAILLKDINDDRIGFISIVDIKISKDFAHAWIFYSQIGSDTDKQNTRKGLSSATPFIHSKLLKAIRYMAIPKLHFRLDESVERGVDLVNKIDELNS